MEQKSTPKTTAKTINYPTQKRNIPGNRPMSMFTDDAARMNPFVVPGLKKVQVDSQLNSGYSFGNYIEGTCNRLARQAGLSISNSPGNNPFNPLMVYGGPGLGKTHLAQAIGIEVKERQPEKVVLYVSANKFQTQYQESVRKNNTNDFIHFYQMVDVLILDDVQDFAGKEKTQNAFFHIFNHLHQNKKQLILTSDKAPAEIKGLENRLLSRFKWGLSAEVEVPDFETRINILRHRNYLDGVELPEDVIQFIGERRINNVRELEGTRISLLANATLLRQEITLDLAQNMVSKLVKNVKHEMSLDFIEQNVADYYNIETEAIQSKSRKREIVQARQITMYFAKQLTKNSLSSIGAQIGGKDHATVLHACKTVKNLIETDKKFNKQVEEIRKKLSR